MFRKFHVVSEFCYGILEFKAKHDLTFNWFECLIDLLPRVRDVKRNLIKAVQKPEREDIFNESYEDLKRRIEKFDKCKSMMLAAEKKVEEIVSKRNEKKR